MESQPERSADAPENQSFQNRRSMFENLSSGNDKPTSPPAFPKKHKVLDTKEKNDSESFPEGEISDVSMRDSTVDMQQSLKKPPPPPVPRKPQSFRLSVGDTKQQETNEGAVPKPLKVIERFSDSDDEEKPKVQFVNDFTKSLFTETLPDYDETTNEENLESFVVLDVEKDISPDVHTQPNSEEGEISISNRKDLPTDNDENTSVAFGPAISEVRENIDNDANGSNRVDEGPTTDGGPDGSSSENESFKSFENEEEESLSTNDISMKEDNATSQPPVEYKSMSSSVDTIDMSWSILPDRDTNTLQSLHTSSDSAGPSSNEKSERIEAPACREIEERKPGADVNETEKINEDVQSLNTREEVKEDNSNEIDSTEAAMEVDDQLSKANSLDVPVDSITDIQPMKTDNQPHNIPPPLPPKSKIVQDELMSLSMSMNTEGDLPTNQTQPDKEDSFTQSGTFVSVPIEPSHIPAGLIPINPSTFQPYQGFPQTSQSMASYVPLSASQIMNLIPISSPPSQFPSYIPVSSSQAQFSYENPPPKTPQRTSIHIDTAPTDTTPSKVNTNTLPKPVSTPSNTETTGLQKSKQVLKSEKPERSPNPKRTQSQKKAEPTKQKTPSAASRKSTTPDKEKVTRKRPEYEPHRGTPTTTPKAAPRRSVAPKQASRMEESQAKEVPLKEGSQPKGISFCLSHSMYTSSLYTSS